jgi:hypothetical protein
MVKFNAKNLGMAVFLGILLVGLVGVANAQQALPRGGDSFETAIEIESGLYKEGRSLKSNEVEYFYIADVKPGQEIEIKGTFTPETELSAIATIDLYDENRTDLGIGCFESGEGTMDILCEVSWMTNSDKESYKYYIRTGSDTWNVISYLLDVSLIDRYDAGSQTDAGDTVEKAMEIASGEYKAYLSGEEGADTKDFYKVAVKKGEVLTAKVTPPSEAEMEVAIYDKDRRVLKDEYASNPGAIVTNSVSITKSGDVFVGVICDRYCSKDLIAYTLNITTEGVVAEEVVAEEGDEGGALINTEKGIPVGGAAEKEGPNWGLIIGIIVLVVIVIIVVYSLLKKKKQQRI